MTRINRINSFLLGLVMIIGAVLFARDPLWALPVITSIMAFTLFFYGIRMLVYYVTLARHMTGGLRILFRAVLLFDFGTFALFLSDIPLLYVMLYLVAIRGFSGVVHILRAREAKRLGAPSWRLNCLNGVLNVIMAVLCLLMIRSTKTAVFIYAFGALYSGGIHIIQAFRKTTSVYIQQK